MEKRGRRGFPLAKGSHFTLQGKEKQVIPKRGKLVEDLVKRKTLSRVSFSGTGV